MAARSPGLSSAGPEVTRTATPISLAITPASVVLPRPGGPESKAWSKALPSFDAASTDISKRSRTLAWPTNSSSRFGRSETSSSVSTIGLSRLSSRISVSPAPEEPF
jgi:hypothetical protein